MTIFHSRARIARLALMFLFCLAGMHQAWSQPSGARGDDFIYRVMPGDTLIHLSNRFTGTADNWPVLQTLNNVSDPYALPIGLELRIPFSLIPEVPAQAELTHVVGQAYLNQQTARPSDIVTEGDQLSTGQHSFITFLLPDGSVGALPPDTTLHIERLRTFMGTGLIDTILSLDRGDLDTTVAPDDQGVGRYEVRTPVSITGVRGTRLRVRTDNQGTRTEVLSGSAQLGSARADGPRVASNQGIAVTADGQILPVRPLLPAPVLSTDPAQPDARLIAFDPVPGAIAYQVRVAADTAGTQPVWSDTINAPPARYQTPGAGTWHVLVRAIDDLGLMSDDARIEVQGRRVLISGSGDAVRTGFEDAVLLTDF